LEGDIAISEFQKKKADIEFPSEPEKPSVKLPEKHEDIETWEGEGGAMEAPQEEKGSMARKPWAEIVDEYRKEKKEKNEKENKIWLEVIADAKREFPNDIVLLIDKRLRGVLLSPEEQSKFDLAKNKWWQERFGAQFAQRDKVLVKKENPKIIPETRKQRRARELKELQGRKTSRMEQLHNAIQNLDNGEPVDEFRDETRRGLYYDEGSERYFIEENGEKKYLGIRDVVSDYAWGIKYVPAGEMIEPNYRQITKRILTNEVRRDLEDIYNDELVVKGEATETTISFGIGTIERKWLSGGERERIRLMGFIGEIITRELLNRLSLDNNLDFVVTRANVMEDSKYKIDFKIRRLLRNRGVNIDSKDEPVKTPKKAGVQLKTKSRENYLTYSVIKEPQKGASVDEMVWIKVNGREFRESFNKWLEVGKPSGGPEQFLSRDLKIKLLKEVTKGLVEISDEDIERIFPTEVTQESQAEQAN